MLSESTGERVANGFAVAEPGKQLEKVTYVLPPLLPDEVEVKIIACGVCLSDVDAVSGKFDAFGLYEYPIVAGHEAVGTVTGVGALVTSHEIGDRVGLGIYRSSCAACRWCLEGHTNVCEKRELMFSGSNTGCFSDYVHIKASFAVHVQPDADPSEIGPLMCAGTTVFAPFKTHNILPGSHVGVYGIGGLGHLALQFARAWGCEVSAFSHSTHKEADAFALGAHHFHLTLDKNALAREYGTLDYLFMTANGSDVDYRVLFSLLNRNGKLIVIGIGNHMDISVPMGTLIRDQKSVCGSAGGSIGTTWEMLKFCRVNDIRPVIEKYPVDSINEVINRVRKGACKYRAVVMFT